MPGADRRQHEADVQQRVDRRLRRMDHHRHQHVDDGRAAEDERHDVDRQAAEAERVDDAGGAGGAERAGDGRGDEARRVEARQVALRAEAGRPARGRRSGSRRRRRRAAPSAGCRAVSGPGAAARRRRPRTARRPPRRSASPYVLASRCPSWSVRLTPDIRRVSRRCADTAVPCGRLDDARIRHRADRLPMAVEDQTEVGSYFVANYPPFSVWTTEAVERDAHAGAARAAGGRACRSGCTCTSRSAGSAATSATSASTPTRTRRRSSDYLDVAGARVGAVRAAAGDRRPAARTSSTSAAARRRSSRRGSSKAWSTRLTARHAVDATPRRSRSSASRAR